MQCRREEAKRRAVMTRGGQTRDDARTTRVSRSIETTGVGYDALAKADPDAEARGRAAPARPTGPRTRLCASVGRVERDFGRATHVLSALNHLGCSTAPDRRIFSASSSSRFLRPIRVRLRNWLITSLPVSNPKRSAIVASGASTLQPTRSRADACGPRRDDGRERVRERFLTRERHQCG